MAQNIHDLSPFLIGEKTCKLVLKIHASPDPKSDKKQYQKSAGDLKNCDVFVDEHLFIVYMEGEIFKFKIPRKIDIPSVKKVLLSYIKKNGLVSIDLPLVKESINGLEGTSGKQAFAMPPSEPPIKRGAERGLTKLWQLKRITDKCRIRLDNGTEMKLESNFTYGFCSSYKGKPNSSLAEICAVSNPHQTSPLQRRVDRELLELKDFNRSIYCQNFIELEVPDGHENPIEISLSKAFKDIKLTQDEEMVRHNLTTHKTQPLPDYDNRQLKEIDCGLISILLAICYDMRTTNNEPTCESAWTRSILTPVLHNFEIMTNVKEVLIAFLRRVVVYPLYRNYDLGTVCILDAFTALNLGGEWLRKELIKTHLLFETSEPSREQLNRYYLKDYIRYVYSDKCDKDYFMMLSANIKNVWDDIKKDHLQLGLDAIEAEYVKVLINKSKSNSSASPGAFVPETDSDSDIDDDDTSQSSSDNYDEEHTETEAETSSSSDGGGSGGGSDSDENSASEEV